MSENAEKCEAVWSSDGVGHKKGEPCSRDATRHVAAGYILVDLCEYHTGVVVRAEKKRGHSTTVAVIPAPKTSPPAPNPEEV